MLRYRRLSGLPHASNSVLSYLAEIVLELKENTICCAGRQARNGNNVVHLDNEEIRKNCQIKILQINLGCEE